MSIAKENRKSCKLFGHEYGPWEQVMEGTWKAREPVINGIEDLLTTENRVSYRYVRYPVWIRRCERCGATEEVRTKPLEVEEAEIKAQIDCLEHKLAKIKNKKEKR